MSLAPTSPSAEFVTDPQRLEALLEHWLGQPAIAIDTEFVRTNTYYPIAALIQIADTENIWLLDPLALDNLVCLKPLLQAPQVVKVLHACGEDLEVFQHLLGVVPKPIFDTQLAAAFLGYDYSMGFQRLAKAALDLSLDKQETRSNWLQRPLTQAQQRYAAEDVAYLLRLYQQQRQALEAQSRLSWLQEECAQLLHDAETPAAPEDSYKRIKLAWKLKPRQLLLLQRLCLWREELAQTEDSPRNFIIPGELLSLIAERRPRNRHALGQLPGFSGRHLRLYGDGILQIIKQVQAVADEQLPEPLPRPLSPQHSDRFKQLKKLARSKAEALNIAPELLSKKQPIEILLRHHLSGSEPQLPDYFEGWRRPLVGIALLEQLRQYNAQPAAEQAPHEQPNQDNQQTNQDNQQANQDNQQANQDNQQANQDNQQANQDNQQADEALPRLSEPRAKPA